MNPGYATTTLLRILFLRGSPERILYERRFFIIGLLAALALSAAAQYGYHQDHLVFVVLRVFAELTIFMLWMVILTGKVARLRLASVMLILVWTSVLMDTVLLSLILPFNLLAATPQVFTGTAYILGGALCYGLVSVVGWGLKSTQMTGMALVHVVGYVACVTFLDSTFRYLFNIVAGAS